MPEVMCRESAMGLLRRIIRQRLDELEGLQSLADSLPLKMIPAAERALYEILERYRRPLTSIAESLATIAKPEITGITVVPGSPETTK